jgi:hypothetical protein
MLVSSQLELNLNSEGEGLGFYLFCFWIKNCRRTFQEQKYNKISGKDKYKI